MGQLLSNFNYCFCPCTFLVIIKIESLVLRMTDKFIKNLGAECKVSIEIVLGPLNAMKSLLWEHPQSAVRNITTVIFRVSLTRIGFSLIARQHYLDVSLWTKSATVDHRSSCSNAHPIYIHPCLDIV